ncbi:MAG TPA: demethoxyubiquinone hydroxylase family protein [Syntrophales bacterium]|nr:demethoxyubiquinone hydroxylase family protein [Syntrophales bacterium]
MTNTEQTLNLLRIFWSSEIVADSLYSSLAARYSDDKMKKSIIHIGEMEQGHAHVWNKIAKDVHGVSFHFSVFLKIKIILMKLLSFIMPLTIFIQYMEHEERKAILEYSKLLATFKDDKRIREIITNIIKQEISHEWHMMEQIANKESYIVKFKEAIPGMTTGIIETLGLVIGLLAAHTTTLMIGLTGTIAMISGTIAMMSISYISSKGHHDLHEGRIKELSIKKEVDPAVLRAELENTLVDKGISSETVRLMIDIVGTDAVALSNLVKIFKIAGEALSPKESVKTTGIFFIVGTLPIIVPFFAGVLWGLGPLIPAVVAFALAIVTISIAGLFTAVLSGKRISTKVMHNISIIVGTCALTYLVGLAARIFFGFGAGY